jgi:plasmid stabilization system protein ParE
MIYGFHPEALDEFDKAAAYYAERQPGLQIRFIDAVEHAISRACDAPGEISPF